MTDREIIRWRRVTGLGMVIGLATIALTGAVGFIFNPVGTPAVIMTLAFLIGMLAILCGALAHGALINIKTKPERLKALRDMVHTGEWAKRELQKYKEVT